MKFIAIRESYCDVYEYKKELTTPFTTNSLGYLKSYCWVIYRGFFGKYKIRECTIESVIFTNIWQYRMNNGWIITNDELGKTLFRYDQLNEAIRICEEKNRLGKVKVKKLP